MINSLTEEQKAKIPEYVRKWTAIGLCTDRVNEKEVQDIAAYYYKKIAEKAVPPIELCPSPRSCWNRICEKNERKLPFVWPFLDGQFNAGYFSYYDFLINELGVKIEHEHWNWYCSTVNSGPIFTLDDYCFISDRPSKINMKNNVLHCEDGPSVRYEDDFKIFSLNGVLVDEYLVMTKWSDLDCRKILTEKNAEVRREFVRKASIEKVFNDLHAKSLDKENDYELLELDLGDNRFRPYLKMVNPSIGVYHIEGVHSDCTTVAAALKFRNGTDEKPVTLS